MRSGFEKSATQNIIALIVAVAVAVLGQLMLQVKDPGFILVEAHEQFRFVGPDLPAQFGANGSRSAGNHDHAVPNMLAHRFQVEVDRGCAPADP